MSQANNEPSPFGGDNNGNIWPWKFSIFGLALILVLAGAIAYRHYTLKVPVGFEDPLKPAETADSTAIDSISQ
ncbi:MAG: hypothetical protein KDD02_17720 [Phaeodactylibacter sp.]|nr:hypothetical protein [Phaeodactylibacter sp.]MCB9301279.1 hypothetical protein [Lewinellaceae bacterium]HQU58133.1 hypothetical protein [Saprospiraceae bacterium]